MRPHAVPRILSSPGPNGTGSTVIMSVCIFAIIIIFIQNSNSGLQWCQSTWTVLNGNAFKLQAPK